ncbi:MAG: cation:dicarboxylase symporter family transporter [Myxococcota bacterium]|jgi:proton glutamate symport protein
MTNMRISQTAWIFIGMAVGLAVGALFPEVGTAIEPLGLIFLRLIKSIVIPIIFSMLVVGIAGHSDVRSVGRMGLKSIVYFEIVTTLALCVGLACANIIRPGMGVSLNTPADPGVSVHHTGIKEVIIHMFPDNFFDSAARGDILEVVVFTVIFALALGQIGEKKKPILDFFESLAETMFKYTNIIMYFAPIGVGAALAAVIGSKGLGIVVNLGVLVACLYGSIILFMAVVLVPIALIARIPLLGFYRAVKGPALIAFSTASSEAALPKAMECMEEFGVPRKTVAFVIPTGYSFNLDGTSLYLALASLFLAEAVGVQLTFAQQVTLGLTYIFTSKGVAGVPRASIVIIAGTLPSFGVPIAAVGILLGIDVLMDMGRTTLNVVGNCLASAVIARWEGELELNPNPPAGKGMEQSA